MEDYVSASVGTPRTINVSTETFNVSFGQFKAPPKLWQFVHVRQRLESYLDGKPNLILPKIFQLFNEDYQNHFVSKVTEMQASGISGEKPHMIDAVLRGDQVYDHSTFMVMPYDGFMSIFARMVTFNESYQQLDMLVRDTVKLFLSDVTGPTSLTTQMHFALLFTSRLNDIHQIISWAEFAAQERVKVAYHHTQTSRIPHGYSKVLMGLALTGGYSVLLEEYIEKITLPDPTNPSYVVKWKNTFRFNSDLSKHMLKEAISASRNRMQQVSLSKQLEFNRNNQSFTTSAAKHQDPSKTQFMLKPAADSDKKRSAPFFFKKRVDAPDQPRRARFNNMLDEPFDVLADVDTMVDVPNVSDSERLSALASYSSTKPATPLFLKDTRKPFDGVQQARPGMVCDGVLLRDHCPKQDTCTYKHDKTLVDAARRKLTEQWSADRKTAFHNMQSSGLFEGMEQDELNHIVELLDSGELPPAVDPHTDTEKFNFLESVCNIQQ